MTDNKVLVRIFVKDFIVKDSHLPPPKLISQEGPTVQEHPNVEKVWPEAEVKGIGYLSNLLGELGKREKLEIVEMSRGFNMWDSNMVILGGQAMKSMDFYKVMENVAYSMDEREIYDGESGKIIPREPDYGYGIILKAKNPEHTPSYGILLGGFGTMGTEAAIYYFYKNIQHLGKEFGSKCFGLVVRAKVSAGYQSARRLKQYDKVFDELS